jgi:hypothetical protein
LEDAAFDIEEQQLTKTKQNTKYKNKNQNKKGKRNLGLSATYIESLNVARRAAVHHSVANPTATCKKKRPINRYDSHNESTTIYKSSAAKTRRLLRMQV